MPAFAKTSLALLALVVLEVAACRSPLPPTEPPRSGDASPGTRTNDTPVAAPITGELPFARSSGGTNALPTPPLPSGGTHGGGSSP